METLTFSTGRAVVPGIYRYAGQVSTTELLRDAAADGWGAWRLNGNAINDKASFLGESARAMEFPAYFGRNWDAYEECITDLSWAATAPGYLLVLDDPRGFASGDWAAWQQALAILAESVQSWRQKDKAFYVLLRRTQGSAPEVPLLR